MNSSRLFCAGVFVLTLAPPVHAENWPSRTMNLIVPFAASGGVDVSARIQVQDMSERLGQAIVVENVGAAAGMAGSLRVAKAEPDGYTMLIGNSGTHAYNQSLYKMPLYNAVSDFTPVGLATESRRILIARKDLPAANLQEFIAIRAKRNSVRPVSVRARICPACSSIWPSALSSRTCLIAARDRRSRI